MQQLASSQVSPEIPINENFESTAVAAMFGKRHPAVTGLTWAGYGGQYNGNLVSDWTVTLTDNATNYVVVLRSTGVVSVATSTTNWNSSSYARIYKLTTVAGAVTAEVDSRLDTNGLYNPNAGGGTAGTLDFSTDGTAAANSDTLVPTQKAMVTFVTSTVNNRNWKLTVRAKTTVALAANTYANGTAGVGATLTGNSNGALAAVDGVTLVANDRLIVDAESTGSHNGFFAVTQVGDASHPYILTRATDADTATELGTNATAYVSEGSNYADQQWTCTTNAPITVGTTALVFGQTGGSGGVSDGDKGDVVVSGSGATWTVDNNAVTYAKQQDVSATARVLGRKTAGSGDPEECTLTEILDFIGSAARGDILFRGSSAWSRLAAGTLGKVLTTRSSSADPTWEFPLQVIPIACSDETTALSAGTGKVTFINPYDTVFNVVAVKASLTTAQTSGSIFTVDVNEAGTSIISTKLTIDNTEKNSSTAATPPVISDASIAANAECTIDIDQIGDGTAKGLKVYLVGWVSPP